MQGVINRKVLFRCLTLIGEETADTSYWICAGTGLAGLVVSFVTEIQLMCWKLWYT